ncbi:AraC family transcriptional regulator [Aquimarina sp. Aq107]|uniref:helix-turn-helix domain-containing protein n=1 Tax=Aquimarina sp. Aq107 TaxID=1191912 RepID=UPI000D55D3CA|nr:AraC family transcriptional regulator [Aquimarina sp. Aq107]
MEILKKGEYTGDVIRQLNIDGNIITNTYYSTGKNNPDWHFHENFHICFVFQGGKAETNKTSTYSKKEGSIFSYFSGEKHRWISCKPISKSANIEIGSDFLKKYGLSENSIKDNIYRNIEAKSIILKMQKEMMIHSIESTTTIHSLLLELVSDSNESQAKHIPYWTISLNELLHDNWNERMTLKEMSETIGVHPVTISKFFRKYFACTLGEYQRKLRIEQSIQLIKNSNLSLSEIAFHCGFSDQSHFTRNFKKMTGFLPKHFQKY